MSKKFIENDYLGTVDVILYECEDGSMSDTITLVQDRHDQPSEVMKISMASFDSIAKKLGYTKVIEVEHPHEPDNVGDRTADFIFSRG